MYTPKLLILTIATYPGVDYSREKRSGRKGTGPAIALEKMEAGGEE
jgi:hypothetical protein